ncbi:MAG: hypothetical protein QG597_3904, partial [Actinomycetota bacterium]|nr:hypothetical protein [Actinomycetota bacterium]
IDWATLFKRTFASDALACGRCHGRMRPLELVTDEELARTLLDRMGLPSDIPEVLPPHDPADHSTGPPTDQLSFEDIQDMTDHSGPQLLRLAPSDAI